MSPWIIIGVFAVVGWTLLSIPIGILVGSYFRAVMEQRDENDARRAAHHAATQSFGFIERAEPMND